MGMASFNANAAASLGATINSLNANLPSLPGGVPPLMPSLNGVGSLAGIVQQMKQQFGIDLMQPGGVAALQAKLDAAANASAAANANASASASGSASASAAVTGSASGSASANASAAASASAQMSALAKASAALGLPLAMPDPLGQLQGVVQSFTAMQLPAVTVPQAGLSNVLASFAAMANIKSGFGVNLLASGSASALAAATAKLDLNGAAAINLAATANASASATASASGSAAASASGSAAADASAAMAADVDAVLGPLNAGSLNALSNILSLASCMKTLGMPLATSPCAVCTFLK